jgi:hypothetical protein
MAPESFDELRWVITPAPLENLLLGLTGNTETLAIQAAVEIPKLLRLLRDLLPNGRLVATQGAGATRPSRSDEIIDDHFRDHFRRKVARFRH